MEVSDRVFARGDGVTIRWVPAHTARFFQLLSGYAMIATFLKERWGLIDREEYCWCSKGRQSREHLFKECTAWTNEIGELWKKVTEASGKGGSAEEGAFRSRRGFGFQVRQVRARPNTAARDLLTSGRYTEVVLAFLAGTRVGGRNF